MYECRVDPSLVVKVEDDAGSFANIGEYELWQNYQSTAIGKWMAPCVDLSPCGAVMLQKRVEPIRRADLPEKVPAFLTDLKLENFGFYDGRVVCCDYASIIVSPSMRLKKADWD